MISASVSLDAKAVLGVLDALPGNIDKVTRSAIGATTTWAKKEGQKRLAASTGIKPSVFSQYRVKARRWIDNGVIWFGYNDVKSGYVGNLTQDSAGAWAEQYYFAGGFVAEMLSGHVGIFKREGAKRLMTRGRFKGKKRQPIVEQVVKLNVAPIIVEGLAIDAQAELERRVVEKLTALNAGVRR
ncbi:MAG: hypothetical protein ACU836_18685 [Gammaproteobacteria bacterium]